MKLHTIASYEFDELSDEAKERARDWYRQGALDYEWWDSTLSDAENIGLKITEFDLGNSHRVKGELLGSAHETVQAILREHGAACDTYRLAQDFYRRRHIGNPYTEEEFRDLLLEEYLVMLRREEEYLLSDESVDESIRANEYDFTEDGSKF